MSDNLTVPQSSVLSDEQARRLGKKFGAQFVENLSEAQAKASVAAKTKEKVEKAKAKQKVKIQ